MMNTPWAQLFFARHSLDAAHEWRVMPSRTGSMRHAGSPHRGTASRVIGFMGRAVI